MSHSVARYSSPLSRSVDPGRSGFGPAMPVPRPKPPRIPRKPTVALARALQRGPANRPVSGPLGSRPKIVGVPGSNPGLAITTITLQPAPFERSRWGRFGDGPGGVSPRHSQIRPKTPVQDTGYTQKATYNVNGEPEDPAAVSCAMLPRRVRRTTPGAFRTERWSQDSKYAHSTGVAPAPSLASRRT
jgi:hypothetical protein